MKLEDIQALWKEDAKIDRYKLTDESLAIPILHSKYYEIYMTEKRVLNRESENIKNYLLAKKYYYTGKMPKEELIKRNWHPFGIHLSNSDIPIVIDADQDVIDSKLRIMEQTDKVEFLKSILQSINQRTYQIRAGIDMIKFEAGV